MIIPFFNNLVSIVFFSLVEHATPSLPPVLIDHAAMFAILNILILTAALFAFVFDFALKSNSETCFGVSYHDLDHTNLSAFIFSVLLFCLALFLAALASAIWTFVTSFLVCVSLLFLGLVVVAFASYQRGLRKTIVTELRSRVQFEPKTWQVRLLTKVEGFLSNLTGWRTRKNGVDNNHLHNNLKVFENVFSYFGSQADHPLHDMKEIALDDFFQRMVDRPDEIVERLASDKENRNSPLVVYPFFWYAFHLMEAFFDHLPNDESAIPRMEYMDKFVSRLLLKERQEPCDPSDQARILQGNTGLLSAYVRWIYRKCPEPNGTDDTASKRWQRSSQERIQSILKLSRQNGAYHFDYICVATILEYECCVLGKDYSPILAFRYLPKLSNEHTQTDAEAVANQIAYVWTCLDESYSNEGRVSEIKSMSIFIHDICAALPEQTSGYTPQNAMHHSFWYYAKGV